MTPRKTISRGQLLASKKNRSRLEYRGGICKDPTILLNVVGRLSLRAGKRSRQQSAGADTCIPGLVAVPEGRTARGAGAQTNNNLIRGRWTGHVLAAGRISVCSTSGRSGRPLLLGRTF
ncbi:hypothetical protein RRG08_052415 [Elysia crispata]|uniref:Uncharacterized protein n=1 Tax=Elysia crispata TaxID=231223 RepID=A0AAE1B255_9GAST|nr:hypothetical protein RRG08_052415 [Elysia crispata]